MLPRPCTTQIIAELLLVFGCFAAAGCNSLSAIPTDPLDAAAGVKQAATQPDATKNCVVEFRSAGVKRSEQQFPIEGEMVVQDVLNKSGALRKFRRLNLELSRLTPQGQTHLMIVSFDSSKKKVEPQCNYHLRPGDRLIVTEDPASVLDEMLESLGGPFAKKKTFAHTAIRD